MYKRIAKRPSWRIFMRDLNIICGIAVIVTTLHLAHGMHHFLSATSHEGMHGIALYSVMTTAVAIWILSLVGGCLLLHRAR
jgi:alcohol dehydrogenase class IV